MQTNRDGRKLKVASLTPHFKPDPFPFLSLSLHLPPVYTHIHTHFPPSPLLPPFLLQLESHLQGNAMSLRHEAVYLGLITAVPLLMTDCVTWFHTHMHIHTPLPRLPRHTQTLAGFQSFSLTPLAYCSNPNCQLLLTAKLLGTLNDCYRKPAPPLKANPSLHIFWNSPDLQGKWGDLWSSEEEQIQENTGVGAKIFIYKEPGSCYVEI